MIKLNDKAEQPIFKVGDFLQRNNPYLGEHEKMVMLVDIDKQRYEVACMKGKHQAKPDFENLEIIDFDNAHEFFKKVG